MDSYGVGTSLVTGSGAPTASMVYKLVEVDGMPVKKRSSHKESRGGRKEALRLSRPTGTITEEVVHPAGRPPATTEPSRVLTVPLVRAGEVVAETGSGRGPRAGGRRAAQPAVGGSEPVARRAGDPDDADRRPQCTAGRKSVTTSDVSVPELLAIAVAALGGSERSGQLEMADAVAQAFDTGEHLVVQAGTGTGKSLAYLVPAIVRAIAGRLARRGVDGHHRAAASTRRPRSAPAGRFARRCAARAARSSPCSKGGETTCA